MLSIPVYNEAGEQIGTESLEEAALGGKVNAHLLKQAVVMYHANRRQGHAVQKTRGEVEGSTRKLFRQKGTGRARMGNLRTPIRRGGGRAFAKKVRDHRQVMPRRMRRLARDQAILSKIQGNNALIVDGLNFDAPKTKRFAAMLRKLNGDAGCVFATNGVQPVLFKSGRNIPKADVMPVGEMNAEQILLRKKLIFTRDAFGAFRQALGAAE